MDYMTLKETSEKMGRFCPTDKLLLRRWSYSRRCKNGRCLAAPQGRRKASRYENKTRKG